jgi:hypothetical protein
VINLARAKPRLLSTSSRRSRATMVAPCAFQALAADRDRDPAGAAHFHADSGSGRRGVKSTGGFAIYVRRWLTRRPSRRRSMPSVRSSSSQARPAASSTAAQLRGDQAMAVCTPRARASPTKLTAPASIATPSRASVWRKYWPFQASAVRGSRRRVHRRSCRAAARAAEPRRRCQQRPPRGRPSTSFGARRPDRMAQRRYPRCRRVARSQRRSDAFRPRRGRSPSGSPRP